MAKPRASRSFRYPAAYGNNYLWCFLEADKMTGGVSVAHLPSQPW
ncbi:hypothetical protein FHY30_001847 [Xanthomonas arboricola]|nr:hypothetical protein [Xanthomonas campestris]